MIKLNPQKITFILSMVALCLAIADCLGLMAKAAGHGFLGGLVPLFDMDQEKNVPTFFSTFLAVIASSLLLAIGMARKQMERPWRLWIGLSVVFLLVGMDDFIAIHEHLNRPVRSLLHAKDIFYFAWIIPYGIFVVVLAGIYCRFVFEMPAHIRNGLLLSAAVFLTGAIGFEMLGGRLFEASLFSKTAFYGAMTTVEESLEMAGLIIFIHTLMRYIEDVQKNILVQLGGYNPMTEAKDETKSASRRKQRTKNSAPKTTGKTAGK